MDYKQHNNMDEDIDHFDNDEAQHDSHLTPGMYTKESKGRTFMGALKTRLSPRAKAKTPHNKHAKIQDEDINEDAKPADDNSSKTKLPKGKVKAVTDKTKAATEKTKALATNAATKTKNAAQNLGDQTSEAAKNCWTEMKHKGTDVQDKLDEIAPRRRYARLGSESD